MEIKKERRYYSTNNKEVLEIYREKDEGNLKKYYYFYRVCFYLLTSYIFISKLV